MDIFKERIKKNSDISSLIEEKDIIENIIKNNIYNLDYKWLPNLDNNILIIKTRIRQLLKQK